MKSKNPLQQLSDFGQSPWVDNLSRGMLVTGELERLIEEDGIVGITSNPTIFDQAISQSDDYEHQMRLLAAEGRNVVEIYDEMTIRDIQNACDVLRPVYERTNSVDGMVSLEVSPEVARDTKRTISEARRLNNLVNRPNVMIKIPGTPESLPAIEQMLYEGVNINITLLFSIDAHREVMDAYLRAMERRIREGKPVERIASVASFFVSRVDTEVDNRLQMVIDEDPEGERGAVAKALLGKVAIANARLAYQEYKKVFTSDRFGQLAGMGARVQRPLWASTSTKNPAYPDTLYIDELIGPNTVQTMAPPSIEAFREHGTLAPTVEKDVELAGDIIGAMEELGIAYDDVIDTLIHEGIEKFAASYTSVRETIKGERDRIADEIEHERARQLGPIADATSQELNELAKVGVAARLTDADPSFWSDDAAVQREIVDRLGWLQSPADMLDMARDGQFATLSAEVLRRGYKHAVLLGMGGSSLAPEVMATALETQPGFPALDILDTTNPDVIARVAERARHERTLFIVSSKSGTTIETTTLFHYFLTENSGVADNFIVITDPGSKLEIEARRLGVWRVFANRPDIGGRYSALSYFGLVPAAIAGIDVEAILEDALQLLPVYDEHHVGAWLGAAMAAGKEGGRDKLTVLADEPWAAFGDWLEQLVAESTGKGGTGIVPVAREPRRKPASYGNDRLFVHIGPEDGEAAAFAEQLRDAGHPVIALEPNLGMLFLTWELATAVAGQRLGINPFDEPNVQEAKDATNRVLSDLSASTVTNFEPRAAVKQTVEAVNEGDYVAIMAFVDPTSESESALSKLRDALGARTGAATTLGFGPRFLHSTGQLHKGGPASGVFLQIVQSPAGDLEIPNREITFSQLFAAQSAGDFITLSDHGLRVVRVEAGRDIQATLKEMAQSVQAAGAVAD